MADLHTRLLAAVQQRTNVARAAASTSGPSERMRGAYSRWDADAWHGPVLDDPEAILIQGTPNQPGALGQFAGPMWTRIAEHIAANDPATVLRHCARDLAVLERHRPVEGHGWAAKEGPLCQLEYAAGEGWARSWPCSEITDLAAAYGIEVTD